MPSVQLPAVTPKRKVWNIGRFTGRKRLLIPKQDWAISARLELAGNLRDAAFFNVPIDSKLIGCELVKLKVTDLVKVEYFRERVSVFLSQTKRSVQFELTGNTRDSLTDWVASPNLSIAASCFQAGFMIARTLHPAVLVDW